MILPCILRLLPKGELMHLKFDSDTGLIGNIPDDIFKFRIFGDDWSNIRDVECTDRTTYGKLEKLILSNQDAVFAVAISNAGYYVQTRSEIFYYSTELVKLSIVYKIGKEDMGRFISIGLRPTKLICKSIVPYQQTLIYSSVHNSVITEDGIFIVDEGIDVKKFSSVSLKTSKLNALNSGRYFASVCYEGKELWAYTEGSTFKF